MQNDQLLGEWVADNRSQAGLGSSFVFYEDGKFNSMFGAVANFKYTTKGNICKITFAGDANPLVEQFEVSGDKLTTKPAEQKSTPNEKMPGKKDSRSINGTLTRVGAGPADAPPIVGVWSFHPKPVASEGPEDPPVTVRYTAGGIGQRSVPFVAPTGHYKLEGDALTMQFEGKAPFTRKIEIDGDHLTLLADGENTEQKYTRAPVIAGVKAAAKSPPKSAENAAAAVAKVKPAGKALECNALEAADHVGETATVTDKVDDVHQTTAGTIFINMGGAYPNNAFTIFIPASSAVDFKSFKNYKGARLSVSGKIGEFKEKPQIVVTDPSQLKVKTPASSAEPSEAAR